jgi:hypothetical protein
MAKTQAESAERIERGVQAGPDDLRDHRASELLRDALDEARDLARLEIAIAREELREDAKKAQRGGGALSVAAGLGLSALTLGLVAIASAFSRLWLGALVLAGVVLAVAVTLALLGWRAIPKQPLAETRQRLDADVAQIKDGALS